MSLYVPLSSTVTPEQVGNKFANLGRIADAFPVPPALCITVDVFLQSLGMEHLAFLKHFFTDLQATVGCFLLEAMPALQKTVEELTIPDTLRAELRTCLLNEFGPYEETLFVVRSSGISEDSGTSSFAGVYQTILQVKGFDALCTAIVECWKAYYSYSAIAARVRAGQYASDPAMAVIVQKMVSPELAGVAFTTHSEQGRVIVEYVRGLGEALVSGTVAPGRYRQGDSAQPGLPVKDQQVFDQVCIVVTKLKDIFALDVDVEWAWDGNGLHILQVRPITATLERRNDSTDPFFCSRHLYLDASLPVELELGECREVYLGYVAKRANAHRLAAASNIATGAAHVVAFNGAGLAENRTELEQLLAASAAPRVVLDINSNLRQVILNKDEVFHYLCETFRMTLSTAKRYTVIMRDFNRGEYGFISRRAGERGLLLEYSSQGLLNINRGIADCERIHVVDIEQPLSGNNVYVEGQQGFEEAFLRALPSICSFTYDLDRQMPGVQLEWVLASGVPYFVDFSREASNLNYSEQAETVMIAIGSARGRIYRLDDDQVLSRLSIGPAVSVDKSREVMEHQELLVLVNAVADCPQKPIIFVRRPYAILSVFFEYVAGFVFTEGSLLCHLAILLRESGIPALICPHNELYNGNEIMITDGHLAVLHTPGQAM